jgi:hemerythrin-like metal-binding protein
MIGDTCPRCKEATGQKVVHQNGEADLVWCQHCYHVRFDKWDFAVAFQPMNIHSRLKVNVEILDNDHVHLMEMLNFLNESGVEARPILEDLKRFRGRVGDHFKREEQFLKDLEYPFLAAHKRHHGKIYSEINRLISTYDAEATSAPDVVRPLKCCLMDLLLEDMKYKDHLSAAGQHLLSMALSRVQSARLD